MPAIRPSLAFFAVASIAAPAGAVELPAFDVAAAPLNVALPIFGKQAQISVGVSDSHLFGVRVRAVRGRMSVTQALEAMLSGTGLTYRRIDALSYRIIAAPVRRRPRPIVAKPGPVEGEDEDIVVTASKRRIELPDFPATVSILEGNQPALSRSGPNGTEAIVNALPSVNSTHLGAGRNKLFIRGVADSSFTGPTQATVGQYLGDVRLTYNAPDPDLTLYDVNRVEVLEGPQGALYGTASIGGIIRIIPNAPQLDAVAGSADGGIVATRHGALGGDAAAMLNLPIVAEKIAVRGVAYLSIDGGYIDDIRRGLKDVNRSRTDGGRIDVRIEPSEGWTIDLGGLVHHINSADSQYAERGHYGGRDMPTLTRASAIDQPFDNDYVLGQLVVKRQWAGMDLLSATGVVHHDVTAKFDATPLADDGAITRFAQKNDITLISNETRLSHQDAGGTGWLIGASIVNTSERLSRTLGPPGNPTKIIGVKNSVTEAALFGEWTKGIVRSLSVSIGGRLAYTRQVGSALAVDTPTNEPKRGGADVVPSVAVTWRPGPRLTAYLRYEEGFRAGGLSVAESGSGLIVKHFKGDSIGSYEAGLRFNDPARDRFSMAASLSYGHWENIQADLIDSQGLPFSANIGTGEVLGLEASARWRPLPGLAAEFAFLLNESDLSRPLAGSDSIKGTDLPNVADAGVRVTIDYTTRLADDVTLSIGGWARYVGRSYLGVSPSLLIRQGRYTDTAIQARLTRGKLGLSLQVDNILDTVGNRFSLGNPFGVMEGLQTTPLRPRSVRVGLDVRF